MIDNHAAYYAGGLGVGANRALFERVRQSDLLLVVGSRLDGLSTVGYSLLDVPRPRQVLAHVYPEPAELGRVYQADLLINATMPEFAAAARAMQPVERAQWLGWHDSARRD
jgi:acetolactate synthase-1/2/3 large subunit